VAVFHPHSVHGASWRSMAEYQDLDIRGAAVAGELGQHLQDLA
jgi:hypothetical protein